MVISFDALYASITPNWYARWDSNPRLTLCKSAAFATMLLAHYKLVGVALAPEALVATTQHFQLQLVRQCSEERSLIQNWYPRRVTIPLIRVKSPGLIH
jgi:hypothetical protein